MTLLKLHKRLIQVEKELDKVRSSSLIDGWQTQRHAKKSRKWDELAKEKFELKNKIDLIMSCSRDNHNEDIFNLGHCLECNSSINKYYCINCNIPTDGKNCYCKKCPS